MIYNINGGIYRVYFNGTTNSEFNGLHPALIVRTLKEEELYIVIPLTSYTKEKMQKIKEKGFGSHIKSIGSIARIDKFQIIHYRDIKGRWKEEKENAKIEVIELIEVNKKLNEYIRLSSEKSEKEYGKYKKQYENIFNSLKDVFDNSKSNLVFTIDINNKNTSIQCDKKNLANLSKSDVYEIIDLTYDLTNVKVIFENNILKITKNN